MMPMRLIPRRVPVPDTGTLARVQGDCRAVVVGGGLAGVSAAAVLAEHGIAVTLLERESYLGGRVGAWTERLHDGEPFEMERGFHAFFRQYYNLRSLLRRVDPKLQKLVPLQDYPLVAPGLTSVSFAGLPRRMPFSLLELVRRSPYLRLKDLSRVRISTALEMLAYDPVRTARVWGHRTAREYLDLLGFPPDARTLFFNVFAHSFFNPEEEFSAGDLLMMFHCYFMANPEGLVFDVLSEPYSFALWQPLRRYLERLGTRVLLRHRARRIARGENGRWRVIADGIDSPLAADVVVVAMDVTGLQTVVAASEDLDDLTWRHAIENLSLTRPFSVLRLWLDRPTDPSRPAFVGTTGFGLLDNVSLYSLFESESRQWAERHGGSVVELHAYALPDGLSSDAIRCDLLGQLHSMYPETRRANVLDERFLLRRDCPAFRPGSHAHRIGPETPFNGIALAGDFVSLSIPCALMERAVASGFVAANHLMARWHQRAEDIWTIPTHGVLAGWY